MASSASCKKVNNIGNIYQPAYSHSRKKNLLKLELSPLLLADNILIDKKVHEN